MSNYQNPMNGQPFELDWDATLTQDEFELPVLPDGDYRFTVVNLEKARHQPRDGGKLPPCYKAILTIRITDPTNGMAVDIRHNLFLHSSVMFRLSEFFAAIGQKQKGVDMQMDWNRVVGSTGLCKVKRKERRDNRAESEIDRFYPAYDLPQQTQPQQGYAAPQAYAVPQQPGGGYTPGRF